MSAAGREAYTTGNLMRKFNLYFALASVIIDAVLLWLAMIAAYNIRSQGVEPYLWEIGRYSLFAATFVPIWLLLLGQQGLYRLRAPLKGWTAVGRILTAVLSGWAIILIYLYLSRSPEALVFPRLIITYGLGLTAVFVIAGRLIVDSVRRYLNERGFGLIRTVIISRNANDPYIDAFKNPIHGRKVQGVVTRDFIDNLNSLKLERPIDEIIIAWPDLDEAEALRVLDWAETHYVAFAQVPTLLSVRATNVETSTLASSPIIFFRRSPLDGWGRFFKRMVDIVVVLPLMLILSPVYVLLAILVRFSSPGPIIYREKRIGQDGREIIIGKFRSMYADWRERFPNIKDWAADEATDVRITPIGRVIRRTNLDEIPQLWDVLIGRMSLVGPRPEQPKYVKQFADEVPGYVKRHYVKSGLTGWAQINGLRGDTPIPERTAYDLFYIQNWSIIFDLRIISGTVLYMLRQFFNR